MAEKIALRERDPEAFYKKSNQWKTWDQNKKKLLAALGIVHWQLESLVTQASAQIKNGKQRAGTYVHVRVTGENDPVFNDATLKTAFQDYLMHEARFAPFTLFIEDRDGDPFGMPALKRPQDVAVESIEDRLS